MEECSPYSEESSTSWSTILSHFIFVVTLLFNIYLIYAIIFLSSKRMSTYKWHLLLHQAAAAIADVSFNFIGRPVLFQPFIMGYPAGIIRGIIPSRYLVPIAGFLLLFPLITVIQLTMSRYLLIKGHDKLPWKHKILMTVFYVEAVIVAVQINRSYVDEKEVVYKLSQQYSCVTSDLFNISGFVIYDNDVLTENCTAILLILFPPGIFTSVYFVVMSYRAINVAQMSPQLARLQRKLLVTLILQIMVPTVIMGIPLIIFEIILSFKITNTGAVIMAISTFSTTGGVCLAFMIPEYNLFKKRNKTMLTQTRGLSKATTFN